MKVKDYIAELQKFDQDLDIFEWNDETWFYSETPTPKQVEMLRGTNVFDGLPTCVPMEYSKFSEDGYMPSTVVITHDWRKS